MKSLRQSFFRNNRIRFAGALLFGIVSVLVSVAFAYLLQRILDVAITRNIDDLRSLIGLSVVLIGTLLLTQMVMVTMRNRFGAIGMRQYKDDAFRVISEKNIASFSKESIGSYISGLTRDTQVIEEGYMSASIQIAILLFSFLGALGLMLWYSPTMTIAVLIFTAIPIIISIVFGKRMVRLERGISDSNDRFTSIIKDLLSGFFVIKSFRAEKQAHRVFSSQNIRLEEEKRKRKNTEGFIQVLSGSVGSAMQIAVFLFGAYLAIQEQITVGVVLAFVQLMNNILEPVQMIPGLLAKRKASLALIEKMEKNTLTHETTDGDRTMSGFQSLIFFDNVTFAYDENPPILREFSVRFEKGKSYALVGESGSGKSTILRLLMRSYDNYTGKICIDDIELRDLLLKDLYQELMIVQQDVFIFQASIRDNITMFQETDPALVGKAVHMAGLSEWVEEKGLDFLCGENGANLSGGERQRISIARSLLRNPSVLLMDEATSSLDRTTATRILQEVLQLKNMTRIFVTHTLDAAILQQFDEILLLREGRIAEQGGYHTLMAKEGSFYAMVTLFGNQE